MDATQILINVTGGEPLVRKDLFEVMKYAKSLGFEWGMTTNGILLDDENIQNNNYLNTLKAIEVASKLECKKFVFAGSQAEYGNVKEKRTCNTECNPFMVYGKYKLKCKKGSDHDPVFEVEAILNDKVLATGSGKSKKLAEQKSAESALKKLKKLVNKNA